MLPPTSILHCRRPVRDWCRINLEGGKVVRSCAGIGIRAGAPSPAAASGPSFMAQALLLRSACRCRILRATRRRSSRLRGHHSLCNRGPEGASYKVVCQGGYRLNLLFLLVLMYLVLLGRLTPVHKFTIRHLSQHQHSDP